MNFTFVQPAKTKSIIHNKHFWIILAMMLFLAMLYNATFFPFAEFPSIFEDISTAKGVHAIISSFLFLIPILYSSVVYKIKGTFITWTCFLIIILPRAILEFRSLENLLIIGLFALVTLLISILMALDYNPVIEGQGDVLRRTTRWHSLARLLKIRDYERQYVVRKLHDNIIQSLLVIANRVNALESGKYGAITITSKKNLEAIQGMLLHMIDDVRRLSQDLRPSILDNVGLLPVLRWHADRVSHESGIKIEIVVRGMEYKLPPENEIIIYRIVQEIFKNIVQHARATYARISLDFASSGIKLLVEDNGQGFGMPPSLSSFTDEGKYGID
ncbi:MAG TPA: histidine kinase, partial [Dehalococcoidia bacterium]|nr:histidine kinase [Dehalococcoidia bacterium]